MKGGMCVEDKTIVDLFWNRKESAIIETSKKYGNYLFKISFNILYSKEDSEECVNDTYLKAWNSIPPTRPNLLKAFLGKITRNLSIDLYRKNHTKGRGSGEVEIAIEELSSIIKSEEDINEILDEKYLVDKINEFLENINIKDRKIFLLRYFYLYSSKEIEKLTNIKVSTINTILYRTRNKLKEHLEKEGINL